MTKIKKSFLLLAMGILALPLFQNTFQPISSAPLRGVFESTPPPVFSARTWFKGEFQFQVQKNIEDSIGLKPDFVRLYNQIDFSLFSIPHAERVVAGKNHELFASGYIRGYLGQDFLGEKIIDEKVKMLKSIQDILWKTKRIFLLVLIPPDKGSFCPENIPDHFLRMKHHQTGRDYFTKKAAEYSVNILDFNPFFKSLKNASRFPLFPTTGVHWTDWGAYLSADSATRYLEQKTGIKMGRFILDGTEISSKPRHNDDDINRTMNLIWDAPHADLAYPEFHMISEAKFSKPSALFIGDSFFWGWYDQGIIDSLFRNKEFWYYDQDVFPESFSKAKSTKEISLREAVERQNFVILFQVGAGGGNPGSTFIERAYAEFDTSADNKIRMIEQRMKNDPEWLALQIKKSRESGIPLKDVLRNDAISLFTEALFKKK